MTDKEYAHMCYMTHKDEYRQRTAGYRKAHPEKVRQYKINERPRQQAYREEHRNELRKKERVANRASMKKAVNSKKGWTISELDALKGMILGGMTYAEIANVLGRSIKSVNAAKQKYFKNLVTVYRQVNYITDIS